MPAERYVRIYILRLMPVVERTLSGRKDEREFFQLVLPCIKKMSELL
jgi:hypothetical protein